jgi:hypothetical protein
MEYINSELGLPVKGYFADNVSSRYLNASGRGWWKTKVIFVATLSAPLAVYMSLSNNDKSRYKTVMGSISNPPSHLIKQYYQSTKSQFPYDANMSSEQLQSLIDSLTNEYNRWGTDADSKAASVARNRKALDKGDNKQIIAEIAAVRSWMQAINDYRAEVIKAYNKAFAREEKEANAPAPTTTTQTAPPPMTAGMGTAIENPSPSFAPTTDGTGGQAATGTTKKFPFTILFMPALLGLIFYAIVKSDK